MPTQREPATTGRGKAAAQRWRGSFPGAKITDRPSQTSQGTSKARLGLAAENPVRAGLPRRHTTEQRPTEVQMPDFDPIDLGVYLPMSMIAIREAAKSILSGLVQAHYNYTSELLNNEKLTDEERKELQASLRDIPTLNFSYQLQEWSWSILRQKLVKEDIEAFAIDEERRTHPINRDFWISEYGNVALSTGVILPIPLFQPRGEIVVTKYSTDDLFRESYDAIYNSLEPPYHKIPSLIPNGFSGAGEVTQEDNVARRGAKSKFDIELFLHEAFALIYDANPMPKTQIDLGRRAAEAYEAKGGKGGRPSEPWVRATIAKLWHRLDLGQE